MPNNPRQLTPTEIVADTIGKEFDRNDMEMADDEKIEVARKLTDPDLEVGGKSIRTVAEDIKKTYTLTRGENEYDMKKDEALLTGALRGMVTERLSALVPLDQADTLFPTTAGSDAEMAFKKLLETSDAVASQDLDFKTLGIRRGRYVRGPDKSLPEPNPGWGKGYKSGMLQGATAMTLGEGVTDEKGRPSKVPQEILDQQDSPTRRVTNPENKAETTKADRNDLKTQQNATAHYIAEVIEGYGGGKASKESACGIYYDETVIPDAFLVHKDGKIYGGVEVKAYTPEEFRLLSDKASQTGLLETFIDDSDISPDAANYNGGLKLGLDMAAEQEMISIISESKEYKERKDTPEEQDPTMIPIVLRVPKDVEDDDIRALQDVAETQGMPYLIVQKLPFTSYEIEELSKEVLRETAEDWQSKGVLKKREEQVLSDFAQIDVNN